MGINDRVSAANVGGVLEGGVIYLISGMSLI